MSSILRSTSDENYPDEFYCPLCFDVMTDPVVDTNGNSYERTAIEDWINRNHTSPITRGKLELSDLRPNRTLKDMIDSAKRQRAKAAAAAALSASTKTNESKTNTSDTINLEVTTRGLQGEEWCLVSITTPDSQVKTPADICVVIDTSGSMCSEAKMQSTDGTSESHGLSILDVVKHATRTIIEGLGDEDRLAIVAYSSQAKSVLPLTAMHNGGKALAKNALSTLQPSGSTNLWDGLKMGLDLLANDSDPKRLTSCFILTDGCPNIVPPRGHLPMLRRYKDSASTKNDFSCIINTYGFGYNLDSTLLDDLAREGQGSYSFIPDSGFVGTVFTNALANLCSTIGKKVKLTLEPIGNGTTFEIERYQTNDADDDDDDNLIGKRRSGTYGGHPCTKASWGWSLDLGSIRYGQSKDIVIRLKSSGEGGSSTPGLRATLSYDFVGPTSTSSSSSNSVTMEKESSVVKSSDETEFDTDLMYHTCRLEAVDTIYEAHQAYKIGNANESQQLISNLIAKFNSLDILTNDKRGRALIKDISGQVVEALSKNEYYTKWGQHYLPSLAGAHLLQLCYNFKDPGVQHYGGELFNSLRDKLDEIFNKLPAPQPSRKPANSYGANGSSSSSNSSRLTSMASYNCRSAPCFPGNALVSTMNRNVQRVDSLKKGDLVMTGNGKYIEIDAIVKTLCYNGKQQLVTLNKSGLQVTPWHPVKTTLNGQKKWSFPFTLAEDGYGTMKEVDCEAIYSFMLPKGFESMIINNVECITLGHGILNDSVASHSFYGTDAVRENLKKLKGYNNGIIELQGGTCVRRNRQTGLACELYQ